MVQVRRLPETKQGIFNVDAWLAQLPGFDDEADRERMKLACELAKKIQPQTPENIKRKRPSYLESGLEMAAILSELQLDEESLIAAVVYPVVASNQVKQSEIATQLGQEVADLIAGVLRMAAISELHSDRQPVLGQRGAQVDNIRKMLVALVDDVRVGLIKLAERTQTIRELKNAPADVQQRVAREVNDVYAPLAHRLGIGHIKWELEDIAFRYLHVDAYKNIAGLLDEKRLTRQGYIENVTEHVKNELLKAGIEAEVAGRAKHISSIWKKMQRKGISFDQLYDIRAIRIMVDELRDCYASLGVVHTLWRNIPGEFDDYIANPKINGYRSLHTAVIGPDAQILEVQIRTRDMHREAELGVCAHWLYKGTDVDAKSQSYELKIQWLRKALRANNKQGDIGDLAQELSEDFASTRIYVFTPQGHVVDVAAGSTPVDFAYHVHTEVGHRCRGAKVDGRIVPLDTVLSNGQQVEILTGKEIKPNRDWLRADLGFLSSGRARDKVKAWFKKQARGQNIEDGKALLERDFKRMALTSVDYQTLAEHLHCKNVDEMYAGLGGGDISASQVLRIAEDLFVAAEDLQVSLFKPVKPSSPAVRDSVTVVGVGNLVTHMAKCCKPLPGDEIEGYVTLGRGVTIHRKDCHEFLIIGAHHPERVISVAWNESETDHSSERFPVDVTIEAFDRTGLLGDITTLLAAMRVNVVNVNTYTDRESHTAYMKLNIEIFNFDQLVNVLGRLSNLPNVISAQRET
ncbi:GTP diphosphokinase [Pseudomonadales bacterium]|nr:GTP diphosphokinase [Pseudomonadales bacterium]